MPRRTHHERGTEAFRGNLVQLLENFERELMKPDLREKVQALVPAYHMLRDLGSSLIPADDGGSGRDRILHYLKRYPKIVIPGDELMVVAGIGEWARRVRELRVQFGWGIATGVTINEMVCEDEFQELDGLQQLRPNDYMLLSTDQDRDAAHRWHVANEIRRSRDLSIRDRILAFLRKNVGSPVTGEELRYVAGNHTEWARRVRELRTEDGWPVVTKNTGRPDLGVGIYLLEKDRRLPTHDRHIPDPVRRMVLQRDGLSCQQCDWSHTMWDTADPRNLELHHKEHHAAGGANIPENLVTLCNVCHDDIHRSAK